MTSIRRWKVGCPPLQQSTNFFGSFLFYVRAARDVTTIVFLRCNVFVTNKLIVLLVLWSLASLFCFLVSIFLCLFVPLQLYPFVYRLLSLHVHISVCVYCSGGIWGLSNWRSYESTKAISILIQFRVTCSHISVPFDLLLSFIFLYLRLFFPPRNGVLQHPGQKGCHLTWKQDLHAPTTEWNFHKALTCP